MKMEKDLYISNKNKIYDNIISHSTFVDFYPKEMDIEITSYCNYRCAMCPHSLIGNSYAENFPFEKIKKLQFFFPYLKRVMIQGDGEPLMHPDFIKISNFISSFGCKLCTTTNLSLLTEEVAHVLAEKYELITLSCDGSNKELYETIRGNGNFENFTNKMNLLISYVDSRKIIVNVVVMRQNISYLNELLKYLSSFGIRKVVFSNLLTTKYFKNVNDHINFLGTYAIEQLEQSEKKAYELGIDLIINWDYKSMIPRKKNKLEKVETDRSFSLHEIDQFAKIYEEMRTVDKKQIIYSGKYHCSGICKNIYEKVYLDVHGNMTLCCYGKMKPIANIFDDDFETIWNGPIYESCRKTFFSGNLPNFCIGCRYAMATNKYDMQEYNFKITDIDKDFADDKVFWENRKS